MAKFKISGRDKDNCKKKYVFNTFNESEARRLAETYGMVVEATKLLPSEPPTENQLNYAKNLRIEIPPNATKDDVSDLISLTVEKDKPSTERHRAFARGYMVEVTEHIGKRALFDRIHAALVKPGRENELAAWFSYRVYRELVRGAENAPIDGPDHTVIQEVAAQLSLDQSAIKSIRRYDGRDLIWFGEYTAPSGSFHTGGSNRTIAYKMASSLLRERITMPPSGNNTSSRQDSSKSNNKQPTGCLITFLCVLVLVVFAIVSLMYL